VNVNTCKQWSAFRLHEVEVARKRVGNLIGGLYWEVDAGNIDRAPLMICRTMDQMTDTESQTQR
jgi:hypothetical protein